MARAGAASACAQAQAWLRVTGAGMYDFAPQILSKAADKNSVILSIYCMEDFATPTATGRSEGFRNILQNLCSSPEQQRARLIYTFSFLYKFETEFSARSRDPQIPDCFNGFFLSADI